MSVPALLLIGWEVCHGPSLKSSQSRGVLLVCTCTYLQHGTCATGHSLWNLLEFNLLSGSCSGRAQTNERSAPKAREAYLHCGTRAGPALCGHE